MCEDLSLRVGGIAKAGGDKGGYVFFDALFGFGEVRADAGMFGDEVGGFPEGDV